MAKDVFEVHGRLFNPRPFLSGEVRNFLREFEDKRKDREVENVFKTLELVTELRDGEVDRLRAQCSSALAPVLSGLSTAEAAADRILEESGESGGVHQAAEGSRRARERERGQMEAEARERRDRVDEEYNRKEQEISAQYKRMESELGLK